MNDAFTNISITTTKLVGDWQDLSTPPPFPIPYNRVGFNRSRTLRFMKDYDITKYRPPRRQCSIPQIPLKWVVYCLFSSSECNKSCRKDNFKKEKTMISKTECLGYFIHCGIISHHLGLNRYPLSPPQCHTQTDLDIIFPRAIYY